MKKDHMDNQHNKCSEIAIRITVLILVIHQLFMMFYVHREHRYIQKITEQVEFLQNQYLDEQEKTLRLMDSFSEVLDYLE